MNSFPGQPMKGLSDRSKTVDEPPIEGTKPKELSHFRFVGTGNSLTADTVAGLVFKPSGVNTWPKYSTSGATNRHLVGFSFSPASRIQSNTCQR